MSLSTPEDPDPLLEFTTEPGGSTPKQADSLLQRVEQLERELAESKIQAATLTSEVATLVRALGDIRKPSSRPPAAAASPRRTATAIVGLIVGLSIGIFGWKYFAGDGDVAIAPAAPVVVAAEAAPAPAESPAPAPAPPAAAESAVSATPERKVDRRYNRGLAPNVAGVKSDERGTASYERGLAPNVARTFVGTLSIDADPGGEVFVNRKSVGSTPLRLTNLRAGSHLIWIQREGYRRFTRVVQVPADRITRLSAQLEPIGSR